VKHYQSILIKALCVTLCGIFSCVASAKPLSPVKVSIMPAKTSGPGQTIEFVVRASVTMDTENLQLTVSVPQAITVLDGELHWQGVLLKGQEKQLRFTASLTDTAANTRDDTLIKVLAAIVNSATSITSAAEADVKTRNSGQLAASAFYRWQTGAAKAAAVQSLPLNSRVVDRSGLKIQEYELRP
jgi:hypothetical protein